MKRSQKVCESVLTKREKTDESDGLGIFPLMVILQEYQVSQENQKYITEKLLRTHLMGSNVTFECKGQAIEHLFARDHAPFLDLSSKAKNYRDFGCYCMPPVFFSLMPDVLLHSYMKNSNKNSRLKGPKVNLSNVYLKITYLQGFSKVMWQKEMFLKH